MISIPEPSVRASTGDGAVSAVLALGGNLGDRAATIADAVRGIGDLDGVELTAVSGFVETPAIKSQGVDHEAPSYLNAVVIVRTTREPHALLDALNEIERGHGRVRDERWGDRTLDIDIISFGELQQSDERLTLPHPRAWQRAFVLAPWLELDPDAVLPGRGRVDALRAGASDAVRPYRPGEGRTR
ncbi:2-amino-4-hydroxy-6-hydroxymethyldihydropteridine diphosphokinase [Luethyella okanaganae]|uniref:2-amino-4-hydroxy-6-hydroxymethyldihydropteridine diphosphokinase n=1 Tax=Luethyella okanaganae TaxID=69372 RepID=A0ABW1VHG0_9MICO